MRVALAIVAASVILSRVAAANPAVPVDADVIADVDRSATRAPQQSDPDGAESAEQAREAARIAVDDKRWDDAARELKRAFRLTGDRVLHRDIGRAYLHGGNCDFAVIYLKRYLDDFPDADDREAAAMQIRQCQHRRDLAQKTLGKSADPRTTQIRNTPPTAHTVERPSTTTETQDLATAVTPHARERQAWQGAWLAAGAGVFFGVAGTVVGLSAEAREADLRDLLELRDTDGKPREWEGELRRRYLDKKQEGERYETMSRALLGAAGVAAVTAGVLFFMDAGAEDVEWSWTSSQENHEISAAWRF